MQTACSDAHAEVFVEYAARRTTHIYPPPRCAISAVLRTRVYSSLHRAQKLPCLAGHGSCPPFSPRGAHYASVLSGGRTHGRTIARSLGPHRPVVCTRWARRRAHLGRPIKQYKLAALDVPGALISAADAGRQLRLHPDSLSGWYDLNTTGCAFAARISAASRGPPPRPVWFIRGRGRGCAAQGKGSAIYVSYNQSTADYRIGALFRGALRRIPHELLSFFFAASYCAE